MTDSYFLLSFMSRHFEFVCEWKKHNRVSSSMKITLNWLDLLVRLPEQNYHRALFLITYRAQSQLWKICFSNFHSEYIVIIDCAIESASQIVTIISRKPRFYMPVSGWNHFWKFTFPIKWIIFFCLQKII